MHYNRYVELLAAKAKVEMLEAELQEHIDNVGLEIMRQDPNAPKFYGGRDPRHLGLIDDREFAYTPETVITEYYIGCGDYERYRIPVDKLFNANQDS